MIATSEKRNSLDNLTVVITGGSDGIGLAAAKKLTELGAQVVLVGRSPEKTLRAANDLSVPYFIADFADLGEVRELAEKLRKNYPTIDILINNAGGIFGERELTVDGNELTLQVNHLAHFLLTNLLIEMLVASGATVINTSSVANRLFGRLDIDDLNMVNKYSHNLAYGNAKLANILFTKELDRRYRSNGVNTVSFHPGNVATNFASGSNSWLKLIYQNPVLRSLSGLISPEEGIDTLLWLVTTTPGKDWEQGEFYYKRKISKANKLAYDLDIAASLWKQSRVMTKFT